MSDPVRIGVPTSRANCVSLKAEVLADADADDGEEVQAAKQTVNAAVVTPKTSRNLDAWSLAWSAAPATVVVSWGQICRPRTKGL